MIFSAIKVDVKVKQLKRHALMLGELVSIYRIRNIRQAVELLLHFFEDFCSGAVLRCAVVDLVQYGIENLSKNKKD